MIIINKWVFIWDFFFLNFCRKLCRCRAYFKKSISYWILNLSLCLIWSVSITYYMYYTYYMYCYICVITTHIKKVIKVIYSKASRISFHVIEAFVAILLNHFQWLLSLSNNALPSAYTVYFRLALIFIFIFPERGSCPLLLSNLSRWHQGP